MAEEVIGQMWLIETKMMVLPFLLLGAGAELACRNSVNTDILQWGPTTGGLQMATLLDRNSGVIRCWVRNGETAPVTYNHAWFGYWEYYGLEIRVGTEWARLARAIRTSGVFKGYAYLDVIPPDIRLLRPRQVIRDVDDERGISHFSTLPIAFKSDSGDLTVTTQRLTVLNAQPPQKSDCRGASFTLELLDFEWPAKVMEQPSVEARVYQAFCQTSLGDRMTLYSDGFALDCLMLRALLDLKEKAKTPTPH